MRVAIPTVDGKLCLHFGHCEEFALVDVDDETRQVESVRGANPPPHAPGVLPRWLAEQGATVIIAGGMGRRAQELFAQAGVEVVVGAEPGDPRDVVEAWLAGTLTTGANVCDH